MWQVWEHSSLPGIRHSVLQLLLLLVLLHLLYDHLRKIDAGDGTVSVKHHVILQPGVSHTNLQTACVLARVTASMMLSVVQT